MALPFSPNASTFYIGLMSGTSLDGIDCVISSMDQTGKTALIAHHGRIYPSTLKTDFMTLQGPSPNEIHLEAICANALAIEYANLVNETLKQSGLKAQQIQAIGAHGQTIRHQPSSLPYAYTWQSLNPALLAELTNIHVISDFRSRDIAANGQGAPLVPGFHVAQFFQQKPLAVLNLGGIGNLTLIHNENQILGFDTGPANLLLNDWIEKNQGLAYDQDGVWAQSGTILNDVVQSMLCDPYFTQPIPKSTGRDYFHLHWLEHYLPKPRRFDAVDIQTSLVELTALSIAQQLHRYMPNCAELIACGGGVANTYLMTRIRYHCAQIMPQLEIKSSVERGVDPQAVEGLAFAWLAWCFMQMLPGNLPSVTGAKAPRILGALYPK